jgi:acyl-coenzyme A thioesterase PaaI-like protein
MLYSADSMLPPEGVAVRFTGSDSRCFGCAHDNPRGLGMVFVRDGRDTTSALSLSQEYEGAPGYAHGGIIATMLDELSCAAVVFATWRFIVTGELAVRYRSPVAIKSPLLVRGRITDASHERYAVVEAEVVLQGQVAATSKGKFFYVTKTRDTPTWRLA